MFRQLEWTHTLKDNQMLNCGLMFFVVNTAYGGYGELNYNPEMQDLTSNAKPITSRLE